MKSQMTKLLKLKSDDGDDHYLYNNTFPLSMNISMMKMTTCSSFSFPLQSTNLSIYETSEDQHQIAFRHQKRNKMKEGLPQLHIATARHYIDELSILLDKKDTNTHHEQLFVSLNFSMLMLMLNYSKQKKKKKKKTKANPTHKMKEEVQLTEHSRFVQYHSVLVLQRDRQ